MADVELFTSSYVCAEVHDNLIAAASDHPSEQEKMARLSRMIDLVRRTTLVPDPPDRPLAEGIILPDKDRPILLAAAAAGASHLLTTDKRHFGPYFGKVVEGVLVLPTGDYLRQVDAVGR